VILRAGRGGRSLKDGWLIWLPGTGGRGAGCFKICVPLKLRGGGDAITNLCGAPLEVGTRYASWKTINKRTSRYVKIHFCVELEKH